MLPLSVRASLCFGPTRDAALLLPGSSGGTSCASSAPLLPQDRLRRAVSRALARSLGGVRLPIGQSNVKQAACNTAPQGARSPVCHS
jgi:hypothetical protein